MIYKSVKRGIAMEKLMKPAEYAKELGISRQAVYAKIKRGILTARNVDGKLYIIVDKEKREGADSTKEKPKQAPSSTTSQTLSQSSRHKEYKALLEAKEETIAVLKDTVKELKESNKQISTTLRGEIDLLKEAFHEMRRLYAHQLEHKKETDAIDIEEHQEVQETIDSGTEEEKWVSLKKLFKTLGVTRTKKREKITKQLKKAHKKGDKRLSKEGGKIKINTAADYRDLLV
jgi:biotin operon repressor